MKISADKKYFIFENQFDKIPAVIIDYIYCFVDNYVPNDKHKKFINNDLLCFINSFKVLKDCFYNVRFLLNDIIMIDYIQQYNYLFITDENYLKFFEKKEYLKNNMIIICDNIHNYRYVLNKILENNIISLCSEIQDYKTFLKNKYYLKDYNNIMKKTTLKKLSKLLKDKNNKKIFEMIDYSNLMDYLYKYKHFIMKECLNICNIIIVGENKELSLITNNNKPYY
jgi:hypothetical protein